jgi:hypothetical protein
MMATATDRVKFDAFNHAAVAKLSILPERANRKTPPSNGNTV